MSPSVSRKPVAGSASTEGEGALGLWYALMIGAVLLIAAGTYAAVLYQQVGEWRNAAKQLTIGQELLRADRDEILQKTRTSEAALATLEITHDQDRARLDGLEDQRRRLQGEVVKLTQDLAQSEQRLDGTGRSRAGDLGRLERDRDRLARELGERRVDMSRLETALAEKDRAFAELRESLKKNEAAIEGLQSEKTDLGAEKAALEKQREDAQKQLAERQQNERLRQIVRGHRASLGEVKPYIAEVGPGDWSVIESWLALQLGRPMAVPDLGARGLSYEGARLIGAAEGPPMVMLLYADADERPVSLTIAPDQSGEQPLATSQDGGLNLLDWREERHAFFLAGETDEEALKAVGGDLLNRPPGLSSDAPVPVSRHIRPSFRPADTP